MTTFVRDDGRELEVIPGFRERVLSYRKNVSPRGNWTDDEYARAGKKRLSRNKRLIDNIAANFGTLRNAEILEAGCGDGLNVVLLALGGAKRAAGIDLDLRWSNPDERGESVRRLIDGVIKKTENGISFDHSLKSLPVELFAMDATRMDFPDRSFDLVLSLSALEHIRPLEELFAEIERVLKPSGMSYHEIDPFYWIRGCHKRGVVDIPWAHARLSPQEFHRFVAESEDERTADKRLNRLETLNRLTIRQWKNFFEHSPFEIVNWEESASPFAEELLKEHPDITSTLLPAIESRDLVVYRIRLWLRKRVDTPRR